MTDTDVEKVAVALWRAYNYALPEPPDAVARIAVESLRGVGGRMTTYAEFLDSVTALREAGWAV